MVRDLRDPAAATVIRRHSDYWNRVPGKGPLLRLYGQPAAPQGDEPPAPEPPPPPPRPYDLPEPLDAAAFRAETEERYDRTGLLADDFINMVQFRLNTEVLIGCPVVEGVTNWAEPCFTDWHQLDGYRVQDSVWYQRMMDNLGRAIEAVDPQTYPFAGANMRGPVDMARAMLGGDLLCAAVFDHPDELKSLLARITDVIIETCEAHSALLPLYEGGQFNSMGIWTPGRSPAFSVDSAWMFSPACYQDFFLPCDIRICEAFDTAMVHLHSASRQHFVTWAQELPKMGLQCSVDELWLPTGERKCLGPSMGDLIPLFAQVCEHTSFLIFGYWDDDVIERAIQTMPRQGYAIWGAVRDPEAVRQRYPESSRFN